MPAAPHLPVVLFVTCTPGLEPALAAELRELGFAGRQVPGGFETSGDVKRVARLSRIASQVKQGGRDLTGLLYQRGYREEVGRAPMRETLAAGVLRLAGYRGTEPLWDPMCGSGTLLIEAALVALEVPPGDLEAPGKNAAPLLKGSDLNAGALGVTRRNARRAGVLEHLSLERADAASIRPPRGQAGLLVSNVPYGKRVEQADLRPVLEGFAERFAGWRFALLMQGRLEVLEAAEQHALSNGGLRCRLYVGVC